MSFRPFNIDPQLSFSNLQDEINRLMEKCWHAGLSTGPLDGQPWAPVVDMVEHEDAYHLYAEMPGVDPNAIDVTFLGQSVTLRGDKGRPEDIADNDRPIRRERRFGSFCRSIDLPADVDPDRMSARWSNGVLMITIPKTEASKPKSVKINVDQV